MLKLLGALGALRKRPLEKIIGDVNGVKLERRLTAWNLILLGIGAIIGAGIFVFAGKGAASYAGPAIVISFMISGLACAFTGLCYAEFAAMIPVSGSAYTYAYATFGELIAFVIGLCLVLEFLVSSGTVAVGWSGYTVSLLKDFGIMLPDAFTHAPFTLDGSVGGIINLPAMFIVFVLTILLIIGIKASAFFNNIAVFIKISVIIFFLIITCQYLNIANWTPFIPNNTGVFGEYGYSGIFKGAAVVFFAYIGFDSVSTAAQESKNPQRDLPIGILGSLFVCTIVYILVSLVLTGVVGYQELNVPDPIAVAIDKIGPAMGWARPIIKIGAIAGLSSVILVQLLAQPRIFMTMANDGLMPVKFGKIHPKFKTPYFGSIVTGACSMLLAGLFPIGVLGEMVCLGTLLIFTIVCLGILIMRYTSPNINRPFKTPWVHVVSIGGALISFLQMLALSGTIWLVFIGWLIFGIGYYFLYARTKSKLHSC
ncbi:MAG: amino acid permease [Oligoflexia bacterium]|nr:amino acid permease [Oligoflexia bacterium]